MVLTVFKKFLVSLLKIRPVIEPVEFTDGLLAFRCSRKLPFAPVTVASRTSAGSVMTQLNVCSYDSGLRLYRGQVANCAQALKKLELPARGAVRLPQAVRVSSRQIPSFFALTEDISVCGLRLATPGVLSVGTTLELSLDLDDPALPAVRVNGEVCWSAKKGDGSYHSGVHFVGIEPCQYRLLERYIQSRLAAQRTVFGEA